MLGQLTTSNLSKDDDGWTNAQKRMWDGYITIIQKVNERDRTLQSLNITTNDLIVLKIIRNEKRLTHHNYNDNGTKKLYWVGITLNIKININIGL